MTMDAGSGIAVPVKIARRYPGGYAGVRDAANGGFP